jgi:hypothetical protein
MGNLCFRLYSDGYFNSAKWLYKCFAVIQEPKIPVKQDCGVGWQEHRAAFQIVEISYRMLAL